MFYVPEILNRKKGKLARVWLAATLNKRLFQQTVRNAAILSVNVPAVCEEIERGFTIRVQGQNCKLALYLSAQLMFGIVRIFEYQVSEFQGSLDKIYDDLEPLNVLLKKRKTRTSTDAEMIELPALPNVPDISEVFNDLQLRPDLNIMPEAEIPRTEEEIQTGPHGFGPLMADQLDTVLQLDWSTLLQQSIVAPVRYENDNTLSSNSAERLAMVNTEARTPRKRGSTIQNAETPTKRLRQRFSEEWEDVRESVLDPEAPQELGALDSVVHGDPTMLDPVADGDPSTMLDPVADVDPALLDPVAHGEPTEIAPIESNLPESDSVLAVESVISEETPPANRGLARRRKVFEDINTTFSAAILKSIRGDVTGFTVQINDAMSIPQRKRTVPGSALLEDPALVWNTDGNSSKYASRPSVFEIFDNRLAKSRVGIFDDQTISNPRQAVEVSNLEPAEIPPDLVQERETCEAPCEDPADAHSNIPAVVSISEPAEVPPPEPVDFQTSENVQIPETVGDMDTTASMTNLVESSVGTAAAPTVQMQPAEIHDTPSSKRSSSPSICEWTKSDLLAQLEVLWEDFQRSVKISQLIPPESTTKANAAVCFTLLLELVKEGQIYMQQKSPYEDIYIYRRLRLSGILSPG